MKMLNSKAEAHVKRAQELLSDQAFGGSKRKRKTYTTPEKYNFYYLRYTKEEVLHRLSDLWNDFEMRHINCLLLLILHGSGSVYDASVPMTASDMLFVFNLSFVFDFLKQSNYGETVGYHGDDKLSQALKILKRLNMDWYISFLKHDDHTFAEVVLFFHSEDSNSKHNDTWHFDGRPGFQVSDILFFACTPEPASGCGTRICHDLPQEFPYPRNHNDNIGDDEVDFLEQECEVLPTENLYSIDLSSVSRNLHRGLLPNEIKNTTRLFYAFEEKYKGQFKRVVRDMDKMKKHSAALVLSHVSQHTHQELDTLVCDLISSKRVLDLNGLVNADSLG